MRAKSLTKHRSACPINIALETIGDSWSLLIVRDLMFKGGKTFNDFLAAEEKIATNILADRLGRLEKHGIVHKGRDPADARKCIYRLTEKGIGLAPALVELVLWVSAHEKTDAPPVVLRAMRSDREGFIEQVHATWLAGAATESLGAQTSSPRSMAQPNPSIKRTRSGLRPPRAAYRER